MIKKGKKRLMVTLPEDIHDKVKEDAEYEERSSSYIAARIIKNFYGHKTEDD